jgi:acyl-coenzyme A synthetase/AMP-(fatty) acid ligase
MTVTYNAAVALLSGKDGARVAYVDETRSITYAELEERANRAGNFLRSLGVHREERVLLVMHDTIDFPAMFLGAIKAGIVPVPINTLLAPKDYAFMIDDSRARAIIVSDALAEKVGAPSDVRVVKTSELQPLLEAQSSQLEAAPTHADEIAFWLYSSGSTGTPKGAMHLHASIEKTVELYAKGTLGMRRDDVVFSAAKLFFAYGLGNALTFPLSIGATTILASERVTPALVARVMAQHAPTIFCGVPTLFASLLADPTFVVSK